MYRSEARLDSGERELYRRAPGFASGFFCAATYGTSGTGARRGEPAIKAQTEGLRVQGVYTDAKVEIQSRSRNR